MSGLLATSHTGIVKGSAGIVGFNTITLPQQSHVSGIVDFLTIPTFRGSGLSSQSSRQKPELVYLHIADNDLSAELTEALKAAAPQGCEVDT